MDLVRAKHAQANGSQETLDDDSSPKVGQWFWHTDEEGRSLACVVHVGSNFVRLKGVHGSTVRVHFDHFWDQCETCEDPDGIIREEIASHHKEVQSLLGKVRDITNQLAITTGPGLGMGNEVSALAVRGADNKPVDEYKAALILAKEDTLPDLFNQIKDVNKSLGRWMSATIIPLEAKVSTLDPIIGAIKQRIFSVELYAGLVEEVEQVSDGEPAALTEKIHLLQRRCYMDEECLAQYEVGGMEFKDLRDFDKWIARPSNRDRILPFPRCIVAFQVRRNRKERAAWSMAQFIRILEDEPLDKLTFLYIRNGQQLFRLSTEIEFDQKLFPDMDTSILNGKLYAKAGHGTSVKLISENQYLGMIEEEKTRQAEYEAAEEDDKWKFRSHWTESSDYHPFDQSNVYYDDISRHVQQEMAKHNRLVLILQGLLDRSPVLHPHPPWSLWTAEGFGQALSLIYDDTRALVAGDKPDFNAYLTRLNESIKPGTVTFGQEEAWERIEAKKEEARSYNRHGSRGYYPDRVRPHGNPGPGAFARVVRVTRTGKCLYEWGRAKTSESWKGEEAPQIRCKVQIKIKRLINVDAYKPGDFRQFFNDPRSRAEYLEWAPMLLEAEEYHAGNRKLTESKVPPPRPKTASGSLRYQEVKLRKALLGKAIRLKRDVETKGGMTYDKGTLWRTYYQRAGEFDMYGILPDGTRDETGGKDGDGRRLRVIPQYYFEVDPTIPGKPKAESTEPEEPREEPETDDDDED